MEVAQLGEMHAASFAEDPKHLGFVLARYKFVAKMLVGYGRVLEIGCGDTTGARVVKPAVISLVGIDNSSYRSQDLCIPVKKHDMRHGIPFSNRFDAIYALDVLEHIPLDDEPQFMLNVILSLEDDGAAIFGSPSLESQAYASELSRRYHCNCKSEDDLRAMLRRFFGNVFVLGMNDENLHCGFGPMTHYRLAICTNPLKS
jgi:predicted TPR repeat methyltransferase